MIRIKSWMGFVTYASPYMLPPGGSVEQTNMICLLPGQISCRQGMQAVMTVDNPALEMWGYSIGTGTDKIFIFTDQGDIEIKDAPAI